MSEHLLTRRLASDEAGRGLGGGCLGWLGWGVGLRRQWQDGDRCAPVGREIV